MSVKLYTIERTIMTLTAEIRSNDPWGSLQLYNLQIIISGTRNNYVFLRVITFSMLPFLRVIMFSTMHE